MRWKANDPDGNAFYDIKLPKFFKKDESKKFPQPYFNRDFEWGRLTGWELEYLNSLISEYKDVMTSVYRRHEIWKALNWAPVNTQFDSVMGKSQNSALVHFKFTRLLPEKDDVGWKKYPKEWKYYGYWVYPEQDIMYNDSYNEKTIEEFKYGAKIEVLPMVPADPSTRGLYEWKEMRELYSLDTVPQFVIPRQRSSYGGRVYNPQKGEYKDERIDYPFELDTDGNIVSINNLDGIIRAKMSGLSIGTVDAMGNFEGVQIPDQEMVYYIRRKYGIAHALDEKYKSFKTSWRHGDRNLQDKFPNFNVPIVNYYLIPFWDDEPDAPTNVGETLYFERPMDTLALSMHKETAKEREETTPSSVVFYDGYISKQIETLAGEADVMQFFFAGDAFYSGPLESAGNALAKSLGFPDPPSPWNTYFAKNDMKVIGSIILNRTSNRTNLEMSWEQIAYFSGVRANWRANKILNEVNKFSKELQEMIEKKPVAEAIPVGYTNELGQSGICFISTKVKDERPWDHLFEDPDQYRSDRSFKKNGECTTGTQYMRHVLYPEITKYISEILYTEKQVLATQKALDRRMIFRHPYFISQTKSGKVESRQYKALKSYVDAGKYIEDESLPSYGNFTYNFFKKPKKPVFWTTFSLITCLEVISLGTHHAQSQFIHGVHHFSHTFAQFLVKYAEPALIAFKSIGNTRTGYYDRAKLDIGIWLFGLYVSTFGASALGFTIKPNSWGALILNAVLILSRAFYDSWYYGSHKREEIQGFIDLLQKASEENYLEGVYAHSKGQIKIKKGPNGQLPIGSKVSSDGKTIINEYENFQKSKEYRPQIQEGLEVPESPEDRRKRINRDFLGKDGDKYFFSQITEKECKTLLEIAKKYTAPDGTSNPDLNSAPNHLDISPFKTKELEWDRKLIEELKYDLPFSNKKITTYDPVNKQIDPIVFSQYTSFFGKVNNANILHPIPSGYEARGPRFLYGRASINRGTNLDGYLNGTKKPTESFYFVNMSTLPGSGRFSKDFKLYGDSREWPYREIKLPQKGISGTYSIPIALKLTDKEKVWLIRKKYGLDEVIPDGGCCKIGDNPYTGTEFPITTNCKYVVDFTSRAFIKKLEERCGEKKEKNKEKEDKDKVVIDEYYPATTHTVHSEKRVQQSIKISEAESQNKRRKERRGKQKEKKQPIYEGTPDSIQNLAVVPRFGTQALIPGNTDFVRLPPTDSESQQSIAFEILDTERDSSADLISNILIDIIGNVVRDSVATNLLPPREPRATPLQPAEKEASRKWLQWWRSRGRKR